MSDVTRLWLLVPANSDGALILPPALELAGVVSTSEQEPAARSLAQAHGAAHHLDESLGEAGLLEHALERWALHFARQQCALVCPAASIGQTVGEALGVGDPRRFELRPGGCAALEWPSEPRVTGDPSALPSLVGFDLDWTPVFLGTGRPKFPGGPGVASSGRA
jgi:hypothetical protein